MERIYYYTQEDDTVYAMEKIKEQTEEILTAMEEIERINEPVTPAPNAPEQRQISEIPNPLPQSSQEVHGIHGRRRRVPETQFSVPPIPERPAGEYYRPPPGPYGYGFTYVPQPFYYHPQYPHQGSFASSSQAASDQPQYSNFYVPSPLPQVYFTPPPYDMSVITPQAPHPSDNPPHMPYTYGDQGIDLNVQFASVDEFLNGVSDDEGDGNDDGIRRNPTRDARNRRPPYGT